MMLKISAASQKAFQQQAETTFIGKATDHMAWRYERLFAVAPRAGLLQAVEAAYQRAKAHGIERAENIVEFIGLAFGLGAQFDDDPQLPWAKRLLGERGRLDESVWIGQLLSRATAYVRNVQGDNAAGLINAVQSLSTHASAPEVPARETFAAGMQRLYPEKAAYMGGECIHALWEHAQSKAHSELRRDPPLFGLVLAAQFVFGTSCLTDPLLIAVCGQGQPTQPIRTTKDFQAVIANGLRAWSA